MLHFKFSSYFITRFDFQLKKALSSITVLPPLLKVLMKMSLDTLILPAVVGYMPGCGVGGQVNQVRGNSVFKCTYNFSHNVFLQKFKKKVMYIKMKKIY